MKKIVLLFALILLSNMVFAQDITQGTWYSENKESRIQLFKQADKVFGKIVWLKVPNNPEGKPKFDKNNPDNTQKNKPIIGLVIIKNLKQTKENTWENGEIYDPHSGKTYSCKLTLTSPKQINLRGFVGFSLIGRTSHLSKAE